MLIFLSLYKIINNYIILPFKITNISFSEISGKFDDPVQEFLYKINFNKVYTSISLGTPHKTIDFYFSMNEYISSVGLNSCLKYSNSSYSPYNSQSYKKIFENNQENENYNSYILSNEQCSIYSDLDLNDNITVNSFEFYLKDNKDNNNDSDSDDDGGSLIERKQFCGTIGLNRFPSSNYFNKKSLIYTLKKNKIINSYSWGLFFFNQDKLYNVDDDTQDKYDGFFIAGVTLDDNINIFNKELVCNVYAEENSLFWTFYFDRIFYYETINNKTDYVCTNNTRVELVLDLNYIISDEQYYKDIKKIYFQKFFDNNTCYEAKSYKKEEGYTYMIICDLSFKDNQRSFPGIYLYSEQLFFAFNLNYKDVFYEYNNKIYFLIVHKESVKDFWRIGRIFLKKYPFMFDYDKKLISYVYLKRTWNPKNHTKNQKRKNEQNNNNNNNSNFKDFIIYGLLFIGIIIGLFIGKRIWNKNKRLKANELEERYNYMDKENNKLGILK
jgi:hypothetical protein